MSYVNIALEGFGIAVTILLLFYCISEKKIRNSRTFLFATMLTLNIFVLSADMLTWILECKIEYTELLYACNFLVYSLGYVITSVFTYYLYNYISEKKKISIWIPRVIAGLCIIAILLVVISLFNHMYFSFDDGIYLRGSLYWLSQVYPIGIVIVDMLIILINCKRIGLHDTISLLSYGILPVIAMVIQIQIYGITLLYISTTLSLLIIYISIHVEQARRLQEKEAQISQMEISIMMSQIQPHFLYNTLTTIQALCKENPEMARKALGDFSSFLRGNMDSLTSKNTIHFSRELEHVKNYLRLEKIRFGDLFKVEYNINEDDFFLPALTIQPIVENAVKYGVCAWEKGGTIIIETKKEDNNILITVKDNGVGVDANRFEDIPRKKDGRSHVGLSNVKKRIQDMTGGDMFICGKKGIGTTISIVIPLQKS